MHHFCLTSKVEPHAPFLLNPKSWTKSLSSKWNIKRNFSIIVICWRKISVPPILDRVLEVMFSTHKLKKDFCSIYTLYAVEKHLDEEMLLLQPHDFSRFYFFYWSGRGFGGVGDGLFFFEILHWLFMYQSYSAFNKLGNLLVKSWMYTLIGYLFLFLFTILGTRLIYCAVLRLAIPRQNTRNMVRAYAVQTLFSRECIDTKIIWIEKSGGYFCQDV